MNDTLLCSRAPYQFNIQTSVLSIFASSERLSEHSAGHFKCFMAIYKTIRYQSLVGLKEKQSLQSAEGQGCYAGLGVLLLEMCGGQTPVSCLVGLTWAGDSDCPLWHWRNGGDSCFTLVDWTSAVASFLHSLGNSSPVPFHIPRGSKPIYSDLLKLILVLLLTILLRPPLENSHGEQWVNNSAVVAVPQRCYKPFQTTLLRTCGNYVQFYRKPFICYSLPAAGKPSSAFHFKHQIKLSLKIIVLLCKTNE